ncbi:hypothetical protein HLH26_05735 [Gluconacetobacter sp. 1b LMG 1731]|uniref:Uncharacterized protein n=1 Tax=Gluconacetobacter dulcium TaxID=2729096 RepID=A0A7W4IJJ3_9PROT|nr:hypothetical protein [Gluconacetobacter dulcium]MBB2164045.1 hypothetical protein [Gluconacetobacter dulcium]MBB2192749.1 hypothetical protein [Gluconacetobacter dulcium]
MSALSKLTFVAEVEAEHDRAPHVRKRFVEGVEVQLQALQAEVENKPFTLTRERREKDEAGETVKFDKAVRFSTWWTKGPKGYSVEPRYGSKKIQLSDAGSIIKTGPKLDDVKAVLELLIQAANAGELDKPLLETSERKRKADEPEAAAETATAKPETPKTGKTERNTRGH